MGAITNQQMNVSRLRNRNGFLCVGRPIERAFIQKVGLCFQRHLQMTGVAG